MFARVEALAPLWEDAVHNLRDVPNVVDLRNMGLVAGIELSPRPGAPGARGAEVMKMAWAEGLMIRVTGDIIALSPPFIITEGEIQMLFEKLAGILRRID
jgi:beta-alanine--pyruvate transaminase